MSAKRLLRQDTREYFRAATEQHTIISKLPYKQILNEEGFLLFKNASTRAKRREFKDEISYYTVVPGESGSWTFDNAHPNGEEYMKTALDPGLRGCFSTLFNRHVEGIFKSTGPRVLKITSCCIFIVEPRGETPGWCLTVSGSLYKLVSSR